MEKEEVRSRKDKREKEKIETFFRETDEDIDTVYTWHSGTKNW